MIYLISFLGAGLIFAGLLLNKIYNKKDSKQLVNKIIAGFGILIFAARCMSYISYICADKGRFWGLASSPLNDNVLTAFSLIFIWFGYTAILFVLMRPFFNIRFANNATRFLCVPYYIATPFLLKPMMTILEGTSTNIYLTCFYSIEIAFGLGISLYYLVSSFMDKEEFKWSDLGFMFLGWIVLSITTMPNYIPQYLIGFQPKTVLWVFESLTPEHRILVYGNIILPFIIYFSLMGRNYEFRKYCLIYMCLGVMINFSIGYNYTTFTKLYDWPLHLCNTALYILPLVLIFNMKRLFYFTYFINVIGALLAMLMPNTVDNIMSMQMVGFWYNHYFAFFMPLLLVSLKMFERPKLRQFIYSMLGFLFYFVLVLVLNTVYTELYGINPDYFFINSNFIGDKLGDWTDDVFDITLDLHIKDHTFTFHPAYQAAYFGTYIIIGLAMWFVYGEGYRFADSNGALFIRLKRMRIQDKELKKALAGRRMDQPMEENAGITFELRNFSKKYGTSKKYAVKDASFKVHGGEIFGFLGPNGAGKSTIIKSTVGIQPITSGEINICGYDVGKQPVQCKSLIGFVPDHYALYEKLTGREYVNYIADIYGVDKKERDDIIERLVVRFELEGSFDNMIKTYSHGMKQKITIMAALVHNPKVWILDEPLTGLDPNSIYQVKECMREHAAKGNIVFFSSHIIDIVEKLCERIAIIKHGEIQCIKTVAEIEASGSTLEQFYLHTIGNEIEGISTDEEIAARDARLKEEQERTQQENEEPTVEEKPKKAKFSFKNLFKKKAKVAETTTESQVEAPVEEVKPEEPVVETPAIEEVKTEEVKEEKPVEVKKAPAKKAPAKKTTTTKTTTKKTTSKASATKKTTKK